ncbi:MAG TPA: methylthioribulose 1-phosphate dehydratase [Actinomycetota bacterium]|nr:methylthioribulose 1-phosphate dehydratase [Actinomycetota bacterium]
MATSQRDLICEMLRLFYDKDWVSGTGGGICSLEAPDRLLLAPSGVHKERVAPEDLFVVDPSTGQVIAPPSNPGLRPSECNGVFCSIIRLRGAGAVAHSHALSAVLAADLAGDALEIKGLEMLKGIRGLSNADVHLVPVAGNTPTEPELVSHVEQVLADERFASSFAILVRDHGAYIWGQDIWEAKRHCEVYHFLFEAVRARAKGD